MAALRSRILRSLTAAIAVAVVGTGLAVGPASAADQMVSGMVRTDAVGVAVPSADTVSGNGHSSVLVQISRARRPDGVLVVTVVPR